MVKDIALWAILGFFLLAAVAAVFTPLVRYLVPM
jgi:hypothetical protein